MGTPTDDARRSLEILSNAQDQVLRKISPRTTIKDIEAVAAGVVKKDGCELVGHVGHSIGLKTEEDPHLWSARNPYPDMIEENMTLALFQTPIQSKQTMGLRLEDTLVVTRQGAKTLTTFPRELLVIS